jgi:hypothetical protein
MQDGMRSVSRQRRLRFGRLRVVLVLLLLRDALLLSDSEEPYITRHESPHKKVPGREKHWVSPGNFRWMIDKLTKVTTVATNERSVS